MNERILVVSDNIVVLRNFVDLITNHPHLKDGRSFHFICAPWNRDLVGQKIGGYLIDSADIKKSYKDIINKYDLVISAHCKQLFPAQMTNAIRCINIHPGLNPFNRGWFPQVFSIINGLPLGATIHEIDEEIDHGGIIDQVEVPIHASDTSLDAYNRVIEAEHEILERSIQSILDRTYTTRDPGGEGNLNLKKDFDKLCEINLDERVTFQQAINRLRALTHGDYKNAYFYDNETGRKIYISIELESRD